MVLLLWAQRHTEHATTWMRVAWVLIAGTMLMLLPDLVFPDQPAATNITCTDAWCATDGFDVAFTSALARGDFKASAMASHVLNFGVSPLIAVFSVVFPFLPFLPGSGPDTAQGAPRWQQIGQDLTLLFACVLIALAFNSLAKVGARRQRPCFYYGRQNETEAAGHPGEEWLSFCKYRWQG